MRFCFKFKSFLKLKYSYVFVSIWSLLVSGKFILWISLVPTINNWHKSHLQSLVWENASHFISELQNKSFWGIPQSRSLIGLWLAHLHLVITQVYPEWGQVLTKVIRWLPRWSGGHPGHPGGFLSLACHGSRRRLRWCWGLWSCLFSLWTAGFSKKGHFQK